MGNDFSSRDKRGIYIVCAGKKLIEFTKPIQCFAILEELEAAPHYDTSSLLKPLLCNGAKKPARPPPESIRRGKPGKYLLEHNGTHNRLKNVEYA